MTTAFLAVRPRLYLHGHYHQRSEATINAFGRPTHVVSLDCDGEPTGNLLTVDLTNRNSGTPPLTQWLTLPPKTKRGLPPNDTILPDFPPDQWSVDDLVRVLNEGRSLHWKVLVRVATRPDQESFVHRLALALDIASNENAIDFVKHRAFELKHPEKPR